MRDLANRNGSVGKFNCVAPVGGGGGGNEGGGGSIFSTGGGFGGGTHFHAYKSDGFACRLQSDSLPVADEERMVASLRQLVQDSLRNYGANINESGNPDSHSFYFAYSIKEIQGRIRITGKRTGDLYDLEAEIEENNN